MNKIDIRLKYSSHESKAFREIDGLMTDEDYDLFLPPVVEQVRLYDQRVRRITEITGLPARTVERGMIINDLGAICGRLGYMCDALYGIWRSSEGDSKNEPWKQP